MAAEEARKLFVAGLPDTYTEDILRQLFEATGGKVLEVSLPKDRATGRPRGFGFVTLATADEAQVALDSLHGSLHAGRPISVRPFQAEPPKREGGMGGGGGPGAPQPRAERAAPAPDRTIYVGNLPYDATEEEVDALFRERNVGPVQRVSLPIDESGRRRGFGFVSMATAEGANAAIEALRGADLRGRPLFVNLAHPRDARPRDGQGGGGPSFNNAGSPRNNGFSSSAPPRPADAAPMPGRDAKPKRATDWSKRKGPSEGERRSKSWDRGDRGRGFDREDWDD
jgi:RNA recognition motif-containing protein